MMLLRSLFILCFLVCAVFRSSAQEKPEIHIRFSRLLATYDFVQQLSEQRPDNEYKQLFRSSPYNRPPYTGFIKQLDTLRLYESYRFQDYPEGQKIHGITTFLIERNMIDAASVADFKRQTFGVVPNSELFALSDILTTFLPVYDSLLYGQHKEAIERKLDSLRNFVQQADLGRFFTTGLHFYHTQWDYAVPFDIAIIPSIRENGFTARAFLNDAASEIPMGFDHYDVLFSVLMHEIYHILYDGQSLTLKKNMESWFGQNPSPNSQYAYLLLNEALATALGNGYVYEQLNGRADSDDWYNVKYISLMARQIYPLVKAYIAEGKPMDKAFVDQYIAAYDAHFSGWTREAEHLMAYRYVLTDNVADLDYFMEHYGHGSIYQSEVPVSPASLERMQHTPITKVVIVSSENAARLKWVKNAFPELKQWKYAPEKEFVYTTLLDDKTKLILVNCHTTKFGVLLEKAFKEGTIR